MNWYSKIKSKISSKDDSPELKRGEMKKILIAKIQNLFPEFQFLEYKNSCYTFEKIETINGIKVYQHFHIIFALKDRNFSCSVASRVNKNYLHSNSFNIGLINSHMDLIVLKKGTGVIPVEEAHYFHNGKVKSSTKIVNQILMDFEKYGKPFLESQIKQLENSKLLKTGFEFINDLRIQKEKLKTEMEQELNSCGHLISRIKNTTYLDLKEELQSIKGIDKETRKNIPKLSFELLEYYYEQE